MAFVYRSPPIFHLRLRSADVEQETSQGRRGSKRSSVDLGPASNVRRERQERMIQQLGHDNVVLKRKVAGFQLALQVRYCRAVWWMHLF